MGSRLRSIEINTYVDIDAADLEAEGYHHEDDCPAKTGNSCAHPDQRLLDLALDDLHQQAGHGKFPVYVCTHEPCRSLYLVPEGATADYGRKRVAS